MNKFLISHIPIGPTYKDRVVHNIKKYEAYKYFDVLITTDDPEYPGFDDIKHLPNVFIDDLSVHRDKYPEFYEVERIPAEKRSEEIYKDQFKENRAKGYRYPLNIQRFVLLYENIGNYDCIIMADCDTVPLHTEEQYKIFEHYVNVMAANSVSSNRAHYVWSQEEVVEFTKLMNIELNKDCNYIDIIQGFDNPLKILKLKSKEKIQSFFNTWNHCCRRLHFHNKHSMILGGSWGEYSEILYAIVYTLENIKVNLTAHDYISLNQFYTYTHLEDRFWDNVIHHKNIDITQNTKENFIKKNMETLIEFYRSTGQEFNHD